MKATRGVATWPSPALRAAAGPALVASARKRAPACFDDLPGSRGVRRGVVDHHALAAPPGRSAAARSCSGRSRTGITTVTSCGRTALGPGRGRNTPEETRRRARICSALRPPTVAPDSQPRTRAPARVVSRRSRSGLPPMRTRPRSRAIVPGSLESPKCARQRRGRRGGRPAGEAVLLRFPCWESARRNLGRNGGLRPQAIGSWQHEGGQVLSEEREVQDVEAPADEEVDELLVEEVSIDGMCGVY